MRDLTVLSTACGAIFMPGFFRCLKENHERNIRIVGTDMVAESEMPPIVDVYYQVPGYSDSKYIDRLLEICKQEKVDIFFPQISMELPLILDHISEFEEIGVKVSISANEGLRIANNKFQLYSFMRSHGIETPQFYKVSNREELENAAHKLGYPEKAFCVKLAESSGSRGVRIIKHNISRVDDFLFKKPNSMYITLEEMCTILDEGIRSAEIFAMEFLPGCEYTVDLLADHGKIVYMAGRRNTVSLMSIAQQSVVERKEKAYTVAEHLVEMLELDGNIGIDYMLDENDEPVLTDINPRITATIVLFLTADLNLPYMRIKQLLGEELPRAEVKYGGRLIRKYNDVLIDAPDP